MRTIKTIKTLTLLAALAVGITPQAGAGLYGITFSEPANGDYGSGTIDVENGFAVSGTFNVTSGPAAALGVWTLYPAPVKQSYPSYLTSPAGAFWYNNAVYLSPATNPQYYPPANPYLDNYGLLFVRSGPGGITGTSGEDELNLWGNSDGSYTLYGDINGNRYGPTDVSGVKTITAVPEPINCALAGFGLIFVGGSAGRYYLGRRRSAAAS